MIPRIWGRALAGQTGALHREAIVIKGSCLPHASPRLASQKMAQQCPNAQEYRPANKMLAAAGSICRAIEAQNGISRMRPHGSRRASTFASHDDGRRGQTAASPVHAPGKASLSAAGARAAPSATAAGQGRTRMRPDRGRRPSQLSRKALRTKAVALSRSLFRRCCQIWPWGRSLLESTPDPAKVRRVDMGIAVGRRHAMHLYRMRPNPARPGQMPCWRWHRG